MTRLAVRGWLADLVVGGLIGSMLGAIVAGPVLGVLVARGCRARSR